MQNFRVRTTFYGNKKDLEDLFIIIESLADKNDNEYEDFESPISHNKLNAQLGLEYTFMPEDNIKFHLMDIKISDEELCQEMERDEETSLEEKYPNVLYIGEDLIDECHFDFWNSVAKMFNLKWTSVYWQYNKDHEEINEGYCYKVDPYGLETTNYEIDILEQNLEADEAYYYETKDEVEHFLNRYAEYFKGNKETKTYDQWKAILTKDSSWARIVEYVDVKFEV